MPRAKMSAYNTDIQTPLFGETQTWERVVNLVIGVVSVTVVTVTFISALVFPSWPPLPVNIFFAICIIFVCVGNILLIYWYRQGDVDPKFRLLIYYNSFCVIALCVCANLYFHKAPCIALYRTLLPPLTPIVTLSIIMMYNVNHTGM